MNLDEWNIGKENFPVIIERLTKAKIGEFPLTAIQIEEILNNCLV